MLIPDDQLKKLLIKNRVIDDAVSRNVSSYAQNLNISFSDALIEKTILTDEQLGELTAKYLKFPFITLSKITITEEVFRLIPERMAKKHKIIAFTKSGGGLKVAMSDPTNTELLSLLSKKVGRKIIPYLATERDIRKTYQIYKKELQRAFDELVLKESEGKSAITALDEVPVATIVDMLINHANLDTASDVHIEPQETSSLVRFRIDGILHDVLIFPKNLHDRFITRIKLLSRLRTDEHLSPQDGKMRVKYDGEQIDIRVSIIPTVDGEKVVLRLLPSRSRLFSFADLGMNKKDLKKLNDALDKTHGMILATGPTGSGKTTTIYAVLKTLNVREKNITTIEDPVEYKIKGINQIHVNSRTNLGFANGLRSILRQDPNIIFVGEIRDIETAGIAVNAALTGHIVLSTLHTNDAATALPRLIDMKVEPFLVASTINVIVAQRLVRKICDVCKTTLSIKKSDMETHIARDMIRKHFGNDSTIKTFKGAGCKICNFTGYAGRIGVFEVLEVSKEIRKLIVNKADADVITKQAVEEKMNTMLDDGLEKVKDGETTFEEILRVLKIDATE